MNKVIDKALDEFEALAKKHNFSYCLVGEEKDIAVVHACIPDEPDSPFLHLVGTLARDSEDGFNPRNVIAWLIEHYPKTMNDFISEVEAIGSLMRSNEGVTQ